MKKAYFDSSAIIKLGNAEAESLALIEYLSDDRLWLATSVISDVEVRRTLDKLRSRGAEPQEHVRGFFLLELTRDIRDRAVRLDGRLRSLDAIHIATAMSLDDDFEFVSYDHRQAAVAAEAGLRVVQPGC